MRAVLLHNPGLMISLGLLLAGALVSGLLAGLMMRAGVSTRGIAFFMVFFAVVVAPQVAGHLALAVKPPMPAAPADTANIAAGATPTTMALDGDHTSDPARTFGADHALGNRIDAHALFASRMPGLRAADAVHWPSGDSVAALAFGSADQAASGLLAYLELYRVAPTLDRGGVELQGELGLGGGLVRLIRIDAALLVVTALDEPALQARLAGLPLLQTPAGQPSSPVRMAPAGEPLVPALQPLVRLFRAHAALQIAGVLGLVAFACWWFFAGTAWAGSVPRKRVARPQTAAALKSRLLAVNHANVPVAVSTLPDGRIAVTWRHADARWADFAAAHQLQRTYRLLLRLDEVNRRVHAIEQSAALDASMGLNGASLQWRTGLGITFFQVDHHRIFGLQIGSDGKPTEDLSYMWRFNLNELKAPFIAAATGAGWDWQPEQVVPGRTR